MQRNLLLITACGQKKENKPTIAGKLYKSSRIRHLYKKSRELQIPFYILSAQYGLIPSTEVIHPYDAIMNQEQCEKLKHIIKSVLKNFKTIIFYRGGARKDYYFCLEKIIKELDKEFIVFGYGNMGDIGKLEKIIQRINNAKY